MGFGWIVAPTISELKNCLVEASHTAKYKLWQMGARGGAYIQQNFSWQKAGLEAIEIYRNVACVD
jgi:hypothetical protein